MSLTGRALRFAMLAFCRIAICMIGELFERARKHWAYSMWG